MSTWRIKRTSPKQKVEKCITGALKPWTSSLKASSCITNLCSGQRSVESIWRLQQFLNLPQHQKTWVADFQGHDLRVHYKFYKMQTDAVNLAKVTKLLHMVDSGNFEDTYSKDFDTIKPELEDSELDESARFARFENLPH